MTPPCEKHPGSRQICGRCRAEFCLTCRMMGSAKLHDITLCGDCDERQRQDEGRST